VTEEPDPKKVSHIMLAQSCDLFLVLPATNNTIAKLAHGIADNMLLSSAMAVPKETKKMIVPAMNNRMYENPITQENISKLKRIGYVELPPVEGMLASGQKAIGSLASLEDVKKMIKELIGE